MHQGFIRPFAIALVLGLFIWTIHSRKSAPASPPQANGGRIEFVQKFKQRASPRAVRQENQPAAERDWQERLQEITKTPERDSEDVELLAKEIPEEDWQLVLIFLLLPNASPAASDLSLCILERWAERSPAEAADWLLKLPDNSTGHAAYRNVATIWAEMELTSAVAWLDQLAANGNKTAAQLAVAEKADEEKEAFTALKILSVTVASEERDRCVKYATRQWATKDRDGAIAWVNQIQDSAMREEMLSKIVLDWGVIDPAEAVAFAANTLPPGKQQEDAVAQNVRFWTARSPEQAAAWVTQLPEIGVRSAAMEGLMEAWAKSDAVKASEWLIGVPASSSRDTAVSMFAPILAQTFPEQAARWVESIQDGTLRASVQEKLNNKESAASR